MRVTVSRRRVDALADLFVSKRKPNLDTAFCLLTALAPLQQKAG